MDGIAFGCLVAILSTKKKLAPLTLKIAACLGLGIFLFSFLFKTMIYESGLTSMGLNVTLLEIGTALLVLSIHQHFLHGRGRMPRSLSPLGWFGKNSYEIYLTHMFVVLPLVSLFSSAGIVILTALSGLLGQLVAKYYSEPLTRYVRRSMRASIT